MYASMNRWLVSSSVMLFGSIRLMLGRNSSLDSVRQRLVHRQVDHRVGHHLAERPRPAGRQIRAGISSPAQHAPRDRRRGGSMPATRGARIAAETSSGARRRRESPRSADVDRVRVCERLLEATGRAALSLGTGAAARAASGESTVGASVKRRSSGSSSTAPACRVSSSSDRRPPPAGGCASCASSQQSSAMRRRCSADHRERDADAGPAGRAGRARSTAISSHAVPGRQTLQQAASHRRSAPDGRGRRRGVRDRRAGRQIGGHRLRRRGGDLAAVHAAIRPSSPRRVGVEAGSR